MSSTAAGSGAGAGAGARAGSSSHPGSAVTVLLRLRPQSVGGTDQGAISDDPNNTGLFELHGDASSVTLHPAPAAAEARAAAATPSTARNLAFGLGKTPSKLARTPVRHRSDSAATPTAPRTPNTSRTPAKQGTTGRAPTPWRTPARTKPQQYTFDHVFAPTTTQDEVFTHVHPLADMVVQGFNATVMAYGPTGSGKTHTVLGPSASTVGKDTGLLLRLVAAIFAKITDTPDTVFSLRVSYVELYNNKIRDLLSASSSSAAASSRAGNRLELPTVDLHERRGRVHLSGSATLHQPIASLEDALKLVKRGNRNRSVGCTSLNEHSSRSHAVFMLDVESKRGSGRGPIRRSRLNIVDLAGSERLSMSGTIHDETLLSETQAINSSLTALADVLSALSSKSKDLWLVPYRNSKLTHLLRDSLGGNAKTVLVAHCQTDITQYRQSKVCLMYATRAKLIRNRPRANLVAADQSELQAKLVLIERLKSQLAAQHATLETLQERQMATEAENDALQAALAERPEPTDVQVDELKRRLRIAERRADPTLHAHLTEALDTAEGLLAEKEALARRLEEVEASTTNQQVERDNLEAQLASTKESLQTQLSQLVEGKHLQELQYDVDKASLEEELLTSRKESRDATLKLLAAQDDADELREEVGTLSSQLHIAKGEVLRVTEQRDALASRLRHLMECLSEVNAAAAEREAEAGAAAAAEARDELQAELDAVREAADSTERKLRARVAALEGGREASMAAERRAAEAHTKAAVKEAVAACRARMRAKMEAKVEAAVAKALAAAAPVKEQPSDRSLNDTDVYEPSESEEEEEEEEESVIAATRLPKRPRSSEAATKAHGQAAASASSSSSASSVAAAAMQSPAEPRDRRRRRVSASPGSALTGAGSDAGTNTTADSAEEVFHDSPEAPAQETAPQPASTVPPVAAPAPAPRAAASRSKKTSTRRGVADVTNAMAFRRPPTAGVAKAAKAAGARRKRKLFNVAANASFGLSPISKAGDDAMSVSARPSMQGFGAGRLNSSIGSVAGSGLFASFVDAPFRIPKVKAGASLYKANKENRGGGSRRGGGGGRW